LDQEEVPEGHAASLVEPIAETLYLLYFEDKTFLKKSSNYQR